MSRSVHPRTIVPSILDADQANLLTEIRSPGPRVREIHVDVMDGHYVPNISLGLPIIASLRSATDVAFDCHLMIADPTRFAPLVLDAGGDSVTFHPETAEDPLGLIHELHEQGGQVGIAIRPSEPLDWFEELLPHVDLVLTMTVEPGFGGQPFRHEVLEKVRRAAAWRDEHSASWRLEVDGGVKLDTITSAAAAGADLFVVGTGIYRADDRPGMIEALYRRIEDDTDETDVTPGAPAHAAGVTDWS